MKIKNKVEKILNNILNNIELVLMIESDEKEEFIINKIVDAIPLEEDYIELEERKRAIEKLTQGLEKEEKRKLIETLINLYYEIHICYAEKIAKEMSDSE